jgi:prolyl oligopeptidase
MTEINLTGAAFAASAQQNQTQPAQAAKPSIEHHPVDHYSWLEQDNPRTSAWVEQQNRKSLATLKSEPGYQKSVEDSQEIQEIYNSKKNTPNISRCGDYIYNYNKSVASPGGILRRVKIDPTNPFKNYHVEEPAWEVVINFDKLNQKEKANYTYKKSAWAGSDHDRCMIALSTSGSDAIIWREFDLTKKEFLTGKRSFNVCEKAPYNRVKWLDKNTLLVQLNSGFGSTLGIGISRTIKYWKRGQELTDAKSIFEAKIDDSALSFEMIPGTKQAVIFHCKTPGTADTRFLMDKNGSLQKITLPPNNGVEISGDHVFLSLNEDIKLGAIFYKKSTLLAAPKEACFGNSHQHHWQVIFKPEPSTSLTQYIHIDHGRLVLNIMDNVASRVKEGACDSNGHWALQDVATPGLGTISIKSLCETNHDSDILRNHYLMNFQNFLSPPQLSFIKGGTNKYEVIKTKPHVFDTTGKLIEQHFAISKDGTLVPYFTVRDGRKPLDGKTPTLITGYGGFGVSQMPSYLRAKGKLWVEEGMAYILTCIRGGGEKGVDWHNGGRYHTKQNSFDDFIAVAEDVIRRQISSPPYMACEGASNGGLTVGAVMVQRPDLFKAVIAVQPLMDMRKYVNWLMGSSWIFQYGDPNNKAVWTGFLGKYSPYHHVPESNVQMPRVFLKSASNDDRVHPAHARKMAALMIEKGHDVLFFENSEGGHTGLLDVTKAAEDEALKFAFLRQAIGISLRRH